MSREYTNKLLDLADQGVISWQAIAESALCYMSEAEVEDMAVCEGFVEVDEEEEA